MSLSSVFIPSDATPRRYVSEETQLRQKALVFMHDYPDVRAMAWAAARTLLRDLTTKTLDPDKVWWHRFNGASSSSRTFTGWQHTDAPVESMTLVELVMRRFSARDQDASDELQVYGGFYTEGPQHDTFDERNEVAVLPQHLLTKFWQLNFADVFQQRVTAFWSAHAETFCELAKARFLALAGLAARDGVLSAADLQALSQLATLSSGPENDLHGHAQRAAASLDVRSFDIGGYESSQIIRVVDAQGRQILYVPGQTPAFHVCDTEQDVYAWVRGHLRDEQTRQGFAALFLNSSLIWQEKGAAFGEVLDRIQERGPNTDNNLVESAALSLLNQNDRAIVGDVFESLRGIAQQQMQSLVHELTSNTSLRKQMWIGYFNAFIKTFGPTAVMAWPLALIMVGAGAVNIGLNVDQALNATTAHQRKAGLVGAILNSIYVLFNLPLLADAMPAVRTTLSATPGQALNQAPLTTGADLMQGIERSVNGETWIMLGQTARRVRYSSALKSWLVVDPRNPFAFGGANTVRLDAQGQWQLQPALRLSGGSPMQEPGPSGALQGPADLPPYQTVQSGFWDIYMQFDRDAEERVSEQALERQLAVITVRERIATDESEVDTEDDEVIVDTQGNEYRIFKTPEGRYAGGRVSRYTEHEDAFNRFLRTGVPTGSRQVAMIEDLADDLALIGYNNRVTLYRGGSGARNTSGLTFRNGHIKAGDVLVTTDFTSFSENPYVARSFASSQAGAPSYGFDGPVHFDDSSIVFELPAEHYLSATPIAPFSQEEEEAESLFAPGHYFKVRHIEEVAGSQYRFIKVQIEEVPAAQAGSRLYEMRTGEPFTRAGYAARLGVDGQVLVERFFPAASAVPAGSAVDMKSVA